MPWIPHVFTVCPASAARWSWNGKELTEEGTHRSKRGAKNEAARNLLRQLATSEAERLVGWFWV